jgi:molecular chaperone GrpE
MVKKRRKPETDTQDNNENLENFKKETIPLVEETLEEEKSEILENDVEDITNSVLSQLISEEELAQLQEDLQEAQKQAEENLDGWQRARAEFANYKKRIEREKEEARARIISEIMLPYLGVMDDFERALKDRPDDPNGKSWAEGIDLIYRKMLSILEAEGVELIPAEGEKFDPTVHEAISQEESEDHDEGQVVDVIRKGYKIGDRVLRPALVRVAK